MEKRIKDFPDYAITDDGKVISYKYKTPRIMKTWYQKSGYENIKLRQGDKSVHKLIHRLVAEAFLDNPNNLPEVNHKNKNPKDNRVENLEWCDRQYNLYESYETMSPTRNFVECLLVNSTTQEVIEEFKSVKAASEYAHEHFGCSITGMIRNHKSKGYEICKKCND